MFVSAGMSSRSNGSKARRATSIGDMEVVSRSLVRVSTGFNWLAASRFVSAAKSSGGWLNQNQPSSSPIWAGFSIQGGCQETLATRLVRSEEHTSELQSLRH